VAKREVKVLESLAKKEEWLEEYRTRMMRLEVDLVVEMAWEVHSWTLWLSTWTPADARVPDTTKTTTGNTTVWTTNKEEETSIAWSTWSISDQARGKKRRRERPDKIRNWTRRC
jgi:hypothetical protein